MSGLDFHATLLLKALTSDFIRNEVLQLFSLKTKQFLAASASLLILGIAGPVFAAPAAGPDQVPNPYVSYATYQDAARVLGFCPLTLSRDSGYALDGISVISGRSSDLSFVRLGQPETKVRIRTALKNNMPKETLGGVYGVKWNKQPVNKTIVSMARLGPRSFAACWETGNYVFAVQGKGMEEAAFQSLLTNSLVEDAEHYFISLPKEKEEGKKTVYSHLSGRGSRAVSRGLLGGTPKYGFLDFCRFCLILL